MEILIFINKGNPCLETNLEVNTHFNLETSEVDFMGEQGNHNREASLDSDRARELTGVKLQDWCTQRDILQTSSAGDDSAGADASLSPLH